MHRSSHLFIATKIFFLCFVVLAPSSHIENSLTCQRTNLNRIVYYGCWKCIKCSNDVKTWQTVKETLEKRENRIQWKKGLNWLACIARFIRIWFYFCCCCSLPSSLFDSLRRAYIEWMNKWHLLICSFVFEHLSK